MINREDPKDEATSVQLDDTMTANSGTLVPQLPAKDVQKLLAVARSTLHEWTTKGKFPLPRKFGGASRWDAHEVQAWIESQPRAGRQQ